VRINSFAVLVIIPAAVASSPASVKTEKARYNGITLEAGIGFMIHGGIWAGKYR
jgi:hypothetical protein